MLPRTFHKAMLLGYMQNEQYSSFGVPGWYSLSGSGKAMEAGMFDDDEPPKNYSGPSRRCILMANNSEHQIEAANCLDTIHPLTPVCETKKNNCKFYL